MPTGIRGSGSSSQASAGLSSGDIKLNIYDDVPSGFLKADGSAVSRTTYANAFTQLSTTFGSGDGSTTFNLPLIPALISPYSLSTVIPSTLRSHRAVVLSDGRICVMGGFNDAGTAQDAVYLGKYENGAITWTTSTAMPDAFGNAAACVLPDGRIFIGGGYDGTNVLDATYFGVVSGDTITWSTGTVLPAATIWADCLALSDGRILFMGGANSAFTPITTTRFGTVSSNTITWAAGTAIPAAVRGHALAALPNSRYLIIGGHDGSSQINTVRSFTISSNTITYTTSTNLPLQLVDMRADTLPDGRVMVMGGSVAGGGAAQNVAYIGHYQPGTSGVTWFTHAQLPTTFTQSEFVVSPQGTCYIIAGLTDVAGDVSVDTVYTFTAHGYLVKT